jgi:hypothetical protein
MRHPPDVLSLGEGPAERSCHGGVKGRSRPVSVSAATVGRDSRSVRNLSQSARSPPRRFVDVARVACSCFGRAQCGRRSTDFATATGLRPSELFALEQRDIGRALGVVYVRRAYANGWLKHTKTRLSNRAVPLQAIALEALDRLALSENPILFANSRGGRIDFRSFGRRHWKPAQTAAGIEPVGCANSSCLQIPCFVAPGRVCAEGCQNPCAARNPSFGTLQGSRTSTASRLSASVGWSASSFMLTL